MRIDTTNELALIGCCDCALPSCASPRLSCQSITIGINCGYALPADYPGLTQEELCKRFANVTYEYIDNIVFVYPLSGGESHNQSLSETTTVVRGINTEGLSCIKRIDSTAWLNDHHIFSETGGSAYQDYDYNETSSSTFATACEGTWTRTDRLDPGTNDSGPYNFCPIVTNEADSTHTKTGNVFFLDDTYEIDDYTDHIITNTVTYSNPIDVAFATAKLAELVFPDDINGNSCNSTIVPRLSCPDSVASATKARYSIGIPSGYDRSTYEVQWDVGFFTPEYDTWKALKDDFDEATELHRQWEICINENEDDSECGEEPVIPDNPGPAPTPAPILISSESWIYGGTVEFSGWFDIPVPEGEGESRIVNLMVKCWTSSSRGSKPTSHGEIYEFE